MNILDIVRLPVNSYRCCYNGCNNSTDLKVVPKKIRIELLIKFKLFISKKSSICGMHMERNDWISCRQNAISEFTEAQQKEIIDLLATKIAKPPPELKPEFNVSDYEIGISPHNFHQLLNHLDNLRMELKSERKCQIALAIYLTRLRTGDFLYRVQKKFNISYETQKKYLKAARKSLMMDFVPLHLGFANTTRQKMLENSTEMARELFNQDDHVILIADATYIYYEKSGNYEIQRSTYNDQKKRNFVKPMIITTPNGYFFDIFGPYKATANDAIILKHVIEAFGPFPQLKSGDIFLLDRGFRDCKQFLQEKGFIVNMPEFIQKTDKTNQLSTHKANNSRIVTACRFVIETRNGHMKEKWKIFNKIWITYEMPHLIMRFSWMISKSAPL